MCKAAEITKNQMTLMREDEGNTVPTVIKKRNAQGSKSKSLQNLKTPSGKGKNLNRIKKKKKLREEVVTIEQTVHREKLPGDSELAPRREPQCGPCPRVHLQLQRPGSWGALTPKVG